MAIFHERTLSRIRHAQTNGAEQFASAGGLMELDAPRLAEVILADGSRERVITCEGDTLTIEYRNHIGITIRTMEILGTSREIEFLQRTLTR